MGKTKNNYPGNTKPLTSRRLNLAPLSQDDVVVVFGLRSNPEIMKYTDNPIYTDMQEAEKYISRINLDMVEGKSFAWVASTKQNDEKIGSVCLFNFDTRQHQAEIGYDMLVQHWRKGYATEMVQSALDLAFEELEKDYVFALLYLENTASVKLLEKLGFKLTGEKQQHLSLMLLQNPANRG